MSDLQFMNVWRSGPHNHQWTDCVAYDDRAMVDRIAARVFVDHGIRRLGVLRIRMKPTPANEVAL